MRRAYRRPVTDADLKKPFELYRTAKAADGFDAGIEMGLSAVLTSPEFLFRIERDPSPVRGTAGSAYGLSHQRSRAGVAAVVLPLEQHPGRRAARCWRRAAISTSPRCSSSRYAACWPTRGRRTSSPTSPSQWLHLRNLDSITPDMRLFPDFDDNLRQAFRQETELFVDSVIREDRSVLDLLRANYTFVNERLAKHYGIPNVYGSRFRRVTFGEDAPTRRTAAAGQHSARHVLCDAHVAGDSRQVDSRQLLGVPPPPPPPNVPALDDVKTVEAERADARAAGRASGESDVRGLSPADGSGRLRAGELRRGRPLAHARSRRADRRVGHACSTAPRSAAWPDCRRRSSSRPELFVAR